VRPLLRQIPWADSQNVDWDSRLTREWLVTNGLGGYASGTVSGVPTRRFHGYLVAALPAPLGRTMILNSLTEEVVTADGSVVGLDPVERGGPAAQPYTEYLTEFRLEAGLPIWVHQVGGFKIEKRLLLPHRQNTVHVTYQLISGEGTLRLRVGPAIHFRPHEALLGHPPDQPYALTMIEDRCEIAAGTTHPPLRLKILGPPACFTFQVREVPDVFYRVEESRGYDSRGNLWSPGWFEVELREGQEATLVASTEEWEIALALRPDDARRWELERRHGLLRMAVPSGATEPLAEELALAADQFIITPRGRVADVARCRAMGDDVRTVIAGYHWFTDWGRDTMISLEGLTLSTGRFAEGEWILRTFAHYVRDGLIPNMFPEGHNEGLYHTADASLWFFHAVDRYLAATGDRATLELILPSLREIVEYHLAGTGFGIGVDAADGLLRQGAEGYQLTWMDAKVDGWVVTPRRGKAVEINALWHNAVLILAEWEAEMGDAAAAARLHEHAERARVSFNRRFWYAEGGHLYDVVDGEAGDDPACRPNQVLAISLKHPVLDRARWEPVMDVVRQRLLTPVGLRSLAPGHPDYKARYDGDLRSRDAAYHQGTVWAWLIGPFVDAWLKTHPDDVAGARGFLDGFAQHFDQACIGTISEIFDAEPPYTPRGCVAQAWSVAEVLRCLLKTRPAGPLPKP
jgi:predicted glycogen debranching enzyme